MNNEINPRATSQIQIFLHCVLFVFLLVTLNLTVIYLLSGSYQEIMRRMSGHMAAWLLLPFGEAMFDGLLLTTNGFVMQIATECSAMHVLTIFIAGICAYPHHVVRYKFFGIVVGTMLLLMMNVIRIAVLGLVGAHAPGAFDFVHTYLWEGVFALLVVAAWIIWVRKLVVGRHLMMKISIALAVSAAGVWVLSLYRSVYLEALAIIARAIARLLIDHPPYVLALNVSGDTVVANFGPFTIFTSMFSSNVYSLLVFLALMATSFVQGMILESIKYTLYGSGAIFILSLGHVMFIIFGLAYGIQPATITILDITYRTFLLSFCIAFYILCAKKLRDSMINKPVEMEGGTVNENYVSVH